jgi:hypothetical protein
MTKKSITYKAEHRLDHTMTFQKCSCMKDELLILHILIINNYMYNVHA